MLLLKTEQSKKAPWWHKFETAVSASTWIEREPGIEYQSKLALSGRFSLKDSSVFHKYSLI